MGVCRFCSEVIGDQDEICSNCGYNPKTDTLTVGFVKKEKKVRFVQKQRKVSSGVKSFMFWGMATVVLSLGIKYQGKLGDVIWKAKNILLGVKVKQSAQTSVKTNPNKITRFTDVRSYQAPADKTPDKDIKIEGIFYDPQGQSYVVINGRLACEKESFGDMVIKKINRDSVEVFQDGRELVLRVSP
jgi:hypothetical protein